MPNYIIFENWPVSTRQRELRSKLASITAASTKSEPDKKTQKKLRIMSIIDTLLKELEDL